MLGSHHDTVVAPGFKVCQGEMAAGVTETYGLTASIVAVPDGPWGIRRSCASRAGLTQLSDYRAPGGRPFPLAHFKTVKPVEQFGDHIALKDRSVLWANHLRLQRTNPLSPAP